MHPFYTHLGAYGTASTPILWRKSADCAGRPGGTLTQKRRTAPGQCVASGANHPPGIALYRGTRPFRHHGHPRNSFPAHWTRCAQQTSSGNLRRPVPHPGLQPGCGLPVPGPWRPGRPGYKPPSRTVGNESPTASIPNLLTPRSSVELPIAMNIETIADNRKLG